MLQRAPEDHWTAPKTLISERDKMVMDVAASTCSIDLDGHRTTHMIRLVYHDRERILEPHDHGIRNGSVQLLGYQTGGSSSRPIPNWLLMKTDEISDLILLDQTFPGGRPTSKGKHIKWDVLFIRVKPAREPLRASAR